MSNQAYLGAILMISSILIMEIDFKDLKQQIHQYRLSKDEPQCFSKKE